ncbi:MAG: transglutaminase family protein [Pseudomonadota bacterium]
MRLSVRHTTRYAFSQPVVHALQRLRLTPKETHGQQIVHWDMSLENAAAQIEYDDQNYNTVTLITVEPGATEVTITCSGIVETHENAGVIGERSGHMPLWSFLKQTKLTKPGPRARALIREVPPMEEGGKLDYLHALSARICQEVAYPDEPTPEDTTAEEAVANALGESRDHAHIFIGAARAADIPARFVSGYLMIDGQVEQDATHAWAEAHIDGLGWVGFDVTNKISPDPRYVRVATGRDFAGAAPLTALSFGASGRVVAIDVAVEQQHDQSAQ